MESSDKKDRDWAFYVPVILHNIALSQFPKEILVMCDNDKLEMTLVLSFVDDSEAVPSGISFLYKIVPTHSIKLSASASMLSVSSALVGSSRARIPQFCPNASARASRIMMEASIF